ncbi:formyltransferase family protein [Candidatus Pelagibacter sp.]|nr:formyltransferase family protein [Candidatus Pelagibacter sp.]
MRKKFIFLGIRLEALEAYSIFLNLKYAITSKNSYVHKFCKKNKIKFILVNEENKIKIFNLLKKEKDCQIICSAGFPYIIPIKILKNFKIRLNSHPSLLPKYKGVSPIKEAYKVKDTQFGVTLHNMIAKVDSGKIIFQEYVVCRKLKLSKIYNIIFKYLEPYVIIKGIHKIKF